MSLLSKITSGFYITSALPNNDSESNLLFFQISGKTNGIDVDRFYRAGKQM